MVKLRELFSCIKCTPLERREKGNYLVTYRDGGAEKHLHMNEIAGADYFGFTTFGGAYIPLHHIRTIKKGSEIIWQKSQE